MINELLVIKGCIENGDYDYIRNKVDSIIQSEEIPVIKLKKIFRQAAQSQIVVNAHNVNNGISFTNKEKNKEEGTKDDFFYINDEIQVVSDEEAIKTAKDLARYEGILAGISSGSNVAVALRLAQILGKGKIVVTVLPDAGERYISTPLFD